MKKIILWLTITLILCGCVDRAVVEQERYKQMCQTWIGHDQNELLRAWGQPQQVYDMPNGNKVYTYIRSALKGRLYSHCRGKQLTCITIQ